MWEVGKGSGDIGRFVFYGENNMCSVVKMTNWRMRGGFFLHATPLAFVNFFIHYALRIFVDLATGIP